MSVCSHRLCPGDEFVGKSFSLAVAGFALSTACGVLCAQSTFAENPPGVEPIVTREHLFSIPFYLNPRQRPPEELFLYVSGNQGKDWSLYQRRAAHQKKFDFQAGGEGEFWFVIRTPRSRSAPDSYAPPEKIVIVDQSKPELDLGVQLGATGQVKASWDANDPGLDTSTFQLSYQRPNDEQWRPVTVRLPVSRGDKAFSGEVSWAVFGQEGKVLVRAEVLDRAGNKSVTQKSVTLHSVALHKTNSDDSKATVNLAAKPDLYKTTSESAKPHIDLSRQRTGDPQLPPTLSEPLTDRSGSEEKPQRTHSVPARNHGWISTGLAQPGSDPFGKSFGLVDPILDPLDALSRANAEPVPGQYPLPVANQFVPNARESNARESNARVPNARVPNAASDSSAPSFQVTKSHRFNLDYEISDAGESGVARVELWITRDEGRSWSAFGVDTDHQSPFQVEVPSEGKFGFRLLIHNGRGASSRPPQPGEVADLWVAIDSSPPEGVVRSAQFTERPSGKQLNVSWDVVDANLGATPIQLSYSDLPDGPWMPLERPVANTGRHDWLLDFRLPPEIYLKLSVQDLAGNMAEILYDQPVKTVRPPPSGRIRAVRPIEKL